MTRRLVITADDFGIDPGTNAAIVDLMSDGLVSATTLMPVAPAAADAVARLRHAGLPAPRLHMTLSSEQRLPAFRPLASDVPSLVDDDGAFPFDAAVAERRASVPDVARELLAQLDWMHSLGLRPTALDSHAGTLYGLHGRSLAQTALEFCAHHQLSFRLPRTLGRALGLAVRGLRAAHRAAVTRADALGVRLPEMLVSSWLPGAMVRSYPQLRAEVIFQLRRLPAGTSELIVHPAPLSARSWLTAGDARKRWWELRLLRDPAFHRALRRSDITVVPAW